MNQTTTLSPTVRLGATGPMVSPLGLGCMGLSGMYGPGSDEQGVATIQRAIERGVTLLDTGDFYGQGHNEMLIRRAIEGRRDKVQLSVKFGALRGPDGSWVGVDTRPVAVKNFLGYTLKRLGVEAVDVYRPARLDPSVPVEDTIGAIAELVKQGYVRHIGLSEVGVETIRRACAVHPIADLQIEYSLVSRGPEGAIFPALSSLGVGATLYAVLSRGLLGGSKPRGAGDFRSYLPRFAADHKAHNDAVVERVRAFASGRGQSPAQLCVAWALAKQPGYVPLLGARTVAQLDDLLSATERPLSSAEVTELEALVPRDAVEGTRYDARQMAHLDSER